MLYLFLFRNKERNLSLYFMYEFGGNLSLYVNAPIIASIDHLRSM